MVGTLGLVLTIIVIASLFLFHATRVARLSVFIPAIVMSIGYLQARKRFCLAFGFSGLFNFGKIGGASKVESDFNRKIDRAAALRLLGQGLAIAVLITAIVTALPSSHK